MGIVTHRHIKLPTIAFDLCNVGRQVLNRHGRVLDERHGLHVAFHGHQQPQTCLADLPDSCLRLVARRRKQRRHPKFFGRDPLAQPFDGRGHGRLALTAILNHQQTMRAAFNDRGQQPGILRHITTQPESEGIEQLYGRCAGLQDSLHGRQRQMDLVELQERQPGARRNRNQSNGDFGHDCQRPFGSADQLSQIARSARHEAIQVIAPTPAPKARRPLANDPLVIGLPRQPVDLSRYANLAVVVPGVCVVLAAQICL